MIISASRRCDLPAWGMDEFMADLRRGERLVPNPYDATRPRLVSLAPEEVECVVFWTRNPLPLLANADELESRGIASYVQLTITGYPPSLEPRVLDTETALDAAAGLADRIGSGLLLWRYDPVLLADGQDGSDSTAPLGAAWHEANFARLASRLEGRVRRVTLSILDEYRHTRSRLARAGYPRVSFAPAGGQPGLFDLAPPLPPDPWPELLASLAGEAARHGMEAVACAEPWDLAPLGIGRAACVDPRLVALAAARIGREAGGPRAQGRDPGQRGACGCAPSVDIGTYGSCRSGCAYCYARR